MCWRCWVAHRRRREPTRTKEREPRGNGPQVGHSRAGPIPAPRTSGRTPRNPRHAPQSGGLLGPARAGAQKPGPRRPPPSRATHGRAPRAAAAPAARAVARRRAASSAARLRLQQAPAAAARPSTAPTRSSPAYWPVLQ